MGQFIEVEDFLDGEIKISQNSDAEVDLEAIIVRIEKQELRRLFGSDLYDLFILDIADIVIGDPTDPRFIAVYNEFYNDEGDCHVFESEGIEVMLKWFIWAEVTRNQPYQNTTVGMVPNEEENSSIATPAQYGWHHGYNKAITTYNAIQRLMIEDSDLYPEFKGIHKDKAGVI